MVIKKKNLLVDAKRSKIKIIMNKSSSRDAKSYPHFIGGLEPLELVDCN